MADETDASRELVEALYQRELEKKVFMGFRESYLWYLAKQARFGARLIAPADDPYLLRIYLSPKREEVAKKLLFFGLPLWAAKLALRAPRAYLHYFFRGDTDRAFHNHPWEESLSFILTTGYREHRWDFHNARTITRVIPPGGFNLIRRTDYHRVELLPEGGCWTLFISGRPITGRPAGHEWSFYDHHKFMFTPWSQWVDRSPESRQEIPPGRF